MTETNRIMPEQSECFFEYINFFLTVWKTKKIFILLIGAFSSRTFVHNYPNSSKIEAYYQANGRLFRSFYNIISLGTYPTSPKLTQKSKSNSPQYPIPDNYVVETEIFGRNLKCETKYISCSKVNYIISWKEGRTPENSHVGKVWRCVEWAKIIM